MISSQARFTDPSAPKANNPGPGHYGKGMVYGNLLKQVGVQQRSFVSEVHNHICKRRVLGTAQGLFCYDTAAGCPNRFVACLLLAYDVCRAGKYDGGVLEQSNQTEPISFLFER